LRGEAILAVAVTARCDGCIAFHSAEAVRLGVSDEELAEALGVAINLNTGAAACNSSTSNALALTFHRSAWIRLEPALAASNRRCASDGKNREPAAALLRA
jgi:AhpD family alkylhydroperoxidase